MKVRAAGIILFNPKSERVLLVKRTADGFWSVPGGRQEKGESLDETAVREFEEETQLAAPPLEMLRLAGDNGRYRVFTVGVDSHPVPQLDHEHSEYMWAHIDDLPKPIYPRFAAFLR